ncbi:hypothetical protein L249_6811 [Ophiocordyceps polyrhachis-furcata BCC 54312]|uniref:Short-chain dehydrogenase/reductase 3 n=1 Tax=Ophiocordyceps polyrhachis-furcata BCC 54312 TaxID=1330021 RepID=A0A367LJG9_9HYPO|nr:hypothetical protein L249_6811 [Ophiocordyceps polyrhachis-furcata BCC 54312]
MPTHKRLLPREGFCADVLVKLVRRTALNPALMLPLVIAARCTARGQYLSKLYPDVATTLTVLLGLALTRAANAWLSDKMRNNWVNDKYDWSKEIVLITGGAAGIGGSIVRMLEERNITVVVLDLQPMSFVTSSRVHHFHCDIRSPERVQAVAATVKAKIGHPTVIINNAGVFRGKSIATAEPGDIRLTFDVNTLAPYWVTKAFLSDMIDRNHGMIVTVSSIAAWLTLPKMVDYAASKAASMAFSEGLAAELSTLYKAPKIRVVSVHPGHTRTPLFEGFQQGADFMAPSLEPESISEAVVTQVLSGRSANVVLPETTGLLTALRAIPDWCGIRARIRLRGATARWRGRQVVQDVNVSPDEMEGSSKGTSESTVLVSEM